MVAKLKSSKKVFPQCQSGDPLRAVCYLRKQSKSTYPSLLSYDANFIFLLNGGKFFVPNEVTIYSREKLELGSQTLNLTAMTPTAWSFDSVDTVQNSKLMSIILQKIKDSDITSRNFQKVLNRYSLEDILFYAIQEPSKFKPLLTQREINILNHIIKCEYVFNAMSLFGYNFHLPIENITRDILRGDLSFKAMYHDTYALLQYGFYFDTLDSIAAILNISSDSIVRYKGVVLGEFKNAFVRNKLYSIPGDRIAELIINNKEWLKKNSGRIDPRDAEQNSLLTEQALAELVKDGTIDIYSTKDQKDLLISYSEYKEQIVSGKLDPKQIRFILKRMKIEQQQLVKSLNDFGNHAKFRMLEEQFVRQGIKQYEKRKNITLNDTQKDALVKIFNGDAFTFVIGEAGSGKTTLIKAFIDIYKNLIGAWSKDEIQQRIDEVKNKRLKSRTHVIQVAVVSYTGRAASVYEKDCQTDYNRKNYNYLAYGTIHNIMHFGIDDQSDQQVEEDNILPNFLIGDYLIIDEASMIDISLFHCILNYTSYGMKIVLVGDPNQVAPIHAGQIFYDLLQTKAFQRDIVKLDHVYRQANNSASYRLLQNILAGKKFDPMHDINKQVQFRDSTDSETNYQIISKLSDEYKYDPQDFIILSAQKQGKFGINTVNKIIQKQLHSPTTNSITNSNNITFHNGDRVLQIKNDYDQTKDNEKVMNGQLGTIYIDQKAIKPANKRLITELPFKVYVVFDDGTVKPINTYRQLNHLMLGYAMTVHKAQGLERKSVLVLLPKVTETTMWSQNMLYTAASRTKQNIFFLGSLATYNKAVKTKDKVADEAFVQMINNQVTLPPDDDEDDIPDEDLPF